MSNVFDTEINSGLIYNTSDNQTSIMQSITGGLTATAVDIGASIWNSLPGTEEVETEDLLGRISGDALKIYQESPDLIKTASLIGGAILPGGLAVKGMQSLRNGSKAVNMFTELGRKRDVAKAAEMFANGAKDSTEYKKLIWGMRGKTALNQTADAVAAEVAILGTMNAHSYMEDYMEDGASNFALSVALGGGLGTTFGLISDAYQLRRATAAVESGAFSTILGAVKPVPSIMPEATKLQTYGQNIKNLDNIIQGRKEAGRTEFDDITYGYALKTQREMQKEQLEILDGMLDGTLKESDQATKLQMLDTITSGSGFWGVEKIKSITAPELMSMGKMNNLLMSEPVLKKANIKGEVEAVTATYFPETGQFGTSKDIQHYAGMAALGLDEKKLIETLPKISGPNFDYSLESLAKTTASIDAEFGAYIAKFSKMDDDEMLEYLKKSTISRGDIPQVQALAARLNQSDTLRNTAKVKIADVAAQADAIIDEVNIARTLGGTPVKYQEAAERLLNNNTVSSKYDILQTQGAGTAYDMLHSWKAGSGVLSMHKAAVAYFARGYAKNARNTDDIALASKFAQVYESPESIQLRKDLLASLADKDGKIYAYRGVNAPKIFGQNPVESMAVTVDKAGQFTGANGKTMLYKIDVDDVVAAIKDIGPAGDNVELLVRASAREAEAVLSADGRIAFREQMSKSLIKPAVAFEAMVGDLRDYMAESKYSLVQSLIAKGFPPAVIAKRANMPLESLNQFIASARDLDAFEALPDIMAYKSADDVAKANSAANRPLQLQGNLKKNTYAKDAANLNARTLTNIDGLFKSSVMMNSGSEAVRQLGQFLFGDMKQALDISRMNLDKITNEAAGNRFFTSADQAARKMAELGPVFSVIGKQIQKLSNNMEEKLLKPISDLMAPVSTDIASLTEFSVAHNLNASLKGWRIYKDRQLWQKVEKLDEAGNPVVVLEPVLYNGKPFTVATKQADELLTAAQAASKELYELSSIAPKITGSANRNDIGLWIPSFNPVDKFVAYVHNKATDQTQMLWGKTKAELDDAIRTFTPEIQKSAGQLMIVTKDNQEWWSKLNGRMDSVNMKRADLGQLKTGSGASAIPQISTDVLAEMAGGYQHYINAQMRNLADLALSDITDTLDNFSAINQSATKGQSLGFVKSITQAPKDAAASMKNLLLGNPSLGEYGGWKSVNSTVEAGLSIAANAVGTAFKLAASPRFPNPFSSKKALSVEDMKKFDYDIFEKELAKAGVVNPFAIYDKAVAIEKYGVSTLLDTPDTSKRIITASNALAATVALRFGELAHPIVNLMSMPILMGLANAKNMPESFLGVQRATAQVPTTQIMYEGVRQMNSPRFAALNAKWEKLGYFEPLVSEASEVLRASRSFEKGAIAKIENALDSTLVNFMSKPADYSEALSRKVVMNTGAALAKRLYPELDDNGVTIFARDFMDKALGNYTASQRPVFFQGTLGVAMGLFQTYMLTLAQGVYRAAEIKDWATLGKAAMAQTTVFGTSSMPGFDPISKAIAANFSDENVDLTTGTYRALGDKAASYMLYGMPSNLTGAAFYTRGDVDPRFPNVLAGVDQIAAANFASQMGEAVYSVGKAVATGDQDTGQAILQALSLQSMSRPLARGSELLSDYSMTRAGNTVQNAEEVWTMTGVAARVLALRPMEEAKLREAQHLNQHYGAMDRDNRQNVVNKLRTAIRNGTVDQERIAEWAEDYFRNNGTPTGWRSAYRNAIAKTEMSGQEVLIDKLDENSPLNYMINNLD